MKLTEKQKRFCQEYLIDLNATQAAIRAGYSKKTAKEQGAQNLSKLNIQKQIQKAIKERENRTEVTQDKVLKELAHLGFSNIKDFIESSHEGYIVFKDMDKISFEEAKAIESVKADYKNNKVEFKLHSKTKTLELLMKHLGMGSERIELSGQIKHKLSIEDMVKAIKEFKSGNPD